MKNLFRAISLFLCLSLFMIPMKANAHTHSGYSHDADVGLNRYDWMGGLSDSLRLSQLSIPGTGNSMAYGGNHTDFTLTQSMDLQTQLRSGIRFLDLGLKVKDGDVRVYNQDIDLGVSLIDVLKTVLEFLSRNNNETVLLKLYSSDGDDGDLSLTVKNLIQKEGLDFLIYDGRKGYNPTLGEVRGQVVLYADYKTANWKEIHYRSVALVQENNYLTTNWDLYSKWESVKSKLNEANRSQNSGKLQVNHLNGNGGALPYFVASGHVSSGTGDPRLATFLTTPMFNNMYPDFPRVDRLGALSTIAFEGTNVLATNYIARNNLNFTGVVVVDFPGAGLINEIIELNYKDKTSNNNGNTNSNNNNNNSGSSSTGNTGGLGFTFKSADNKSQETSNSSNSSNSSSENKTTNNGFSFSN